MYTRVWGRVGGGRGANAEGQGNSLFEFKYVVPS